MVRAGLSLEPLPQGCTPGLDQSLVGRQCLDHPCRAGGKDCSKLGGAPGSGSQPRSAELQPGQGALSLIGPRVGAGVRVVGRCAETPRLPGVGRDPRGGGSRGSCCLASPPQQMPEAQAGTATCPWAGRDPGPGSHGLAVIPGLQCSSCQESSPTPSIPGTHSPVSWTLEGMPRAHPCLCHLQSRPRQQPPGSQARGQAGSGRSRAGSGSAVPLGTGGHPTHTRPRLGGQVAEGSPPGPPLPGASSRWHEGPQPC